MQPGQKPSDTLSSMLSPQCSRFLSKGRLGQGQRAGGLPSGVIHVTTWSARTPRKQGQAWWYPGPLSSGMAQRGRGLVGHDPGGAPSTPHHWGRPLLSAQQAKGPCSKQASKRALLTPTPRSSVTTRPGHVHLHVAMDVGGQGGPVEDEVVHHHVQCQSWSPVRDGLLQGAGRLLLGFDLLLMEGMTIRKRGQCWVGNGTGMDGVRQRRGAAQRCQPPTPSLPRSHVGPGSHWLWFAMQPSTAASQGR